MKKEILRMEHISVKKNTGYALSDFRLNVFEGECMSVFGFEGSGVRELGELILGRIILSDGRIEFNEKEINPESGNLSSEKGLFIIGVDTVVMPELTVAENLFFGEVRHYFSLRANTKKQEAFAKSMLTKFDVNIDVKRKGRTLLFHEIIMISLVRAYAQNARLIVFIDPPDLNTIRFGQEILSILEKMKKSGISVLWIDNHVDSISRIIDGITIIRNGRNARTFYHEKYSFAEITRIAENREIADVLHSTSKKTNGEKLLEIENICSKHLNKAQLNVKKGIINGITANDPEILKELRGIICGEVTEYSGAMFLERRNYKPANYADAVKRGVQYVDIMRFENHYIPRMSVIDNMLLQSYWRNNSVFGIVSSSQKKYMEAELRKRHRDWKLEKWDDLLTWQQQILLLERFIFQPGKICIITEPFIKFNREMAEMALNIFHEIISREKTVVLFSVSIQDLMAACDEINIISNGQHVMTVERSEWED